MATASECPCTSAWQHKTAQRPDIPLKNPRRTSQSMASSTTTLPQQSKQNPRYVANGQSTPRMFHTPKTGQKEQHVYVLTMGLTPSISVPLEQMRAEYFPKHLNRTPAHLTLFHALPHSKMEQIDADLEEVSTDSREFGISTGRPFRMSKGVAIGLADGEPECARIRDELKCRWSWWLSDQDNRGWQPHWTVMNKVDDAKKVDQAFNTLRRVLFEDVSRGRALGLDLWRYEGGQWQWMKAYPFSRHGERPPSKRRDSSRSNKSRKSSKSGGSDGQNAEVRAPGKRPGMFKGAKKVSGEIWKSITGRSKSQQEDAGKQV